MAGEPYRLNNPEHARILFARASAYEWIAREAQHWGTRLGGTDWRRFTEPLLGLSRNLQLLADCDRTIGRHLRAEPLPAESTPARPASDSDLRKSQPRLMPVEGPDDD